MSLLTGKGCGVSMKLSPELGEEQCCKDKCECVPSFSEVPAFSRGGQMVNKPRLGTDISEDPACASSLRLSQLCLSEAASSHLQTNDKIRNVNYITHFQFLNYQNLSFSSRIFFGRPHIKNFKEAIITKQSAWSCGAICPFNSSTTSEDELKNPGSNEF